MRVPPPSLLRHGNAIACVTFALAIAYYLDPLSNRATFFILLAAVIVSTWLGGLGPGAVALGLGALGAWYFLLPPRLSFEVHNPQDVVLVVFFVLVSMAVMLLTDSRRRLIEQLTRRSWDLEEEVRERRRIEGALREAEAHARSLFERNPVPTAVVDPQTLRYLDVNEAAVRHYGYSREEFLTMTIMDIRPPEDRVPLVNAMSEAAGKPVWDYGIWRHYKRDGTLVFVDITAHAMMFDDRPALLAVCHDVTAQVKEQNVLHTMVDRLSDEVRARSRDLEAKKAQLQAATVELSVTEDRERKRLAQAVHDNLAQLLLFSKMKLERIQRKRDFKKSWLALIEVKHLLDQALESARTLTLDLQPPLLGDEDDLTAALAWVAEKMRAHGLTVTIAEHGVPQVVEHDIVIIVYRAVQELLWNVIKHADTREATMTIDRYDNHVDVLVEDYGKGFDSTGPRTPSKAGGLGLFSINERVESIGGQFQVASVPRHGTQVRLRVPVR